MLQRYTVPAGARSRQCKGIHCKREIFDILTPKNALMPVDCQADEHCRMPSLPGVLPAVDGIGISHFKNCVDVKQFSGRNRK